MSTHRMQLDVKDRTLIVSCACGQWRRAEGLDTEELPSEIMQRLEEQHAQHVAGQQSAPKGGSG
jgi:hypothetical protein